MDKCKVGQFLKSLRQQKGKTQYEVSMDLAEYGIDASDKTVAKWEKGNFPNMDKLGIIAEYYGVKVSDILNGEIYTPQDLQKKYFIVKDEWFHNSPEDDWYKTSKAQAQLIKATVKELFSELIEKKSLTPRQNDELDFLLKNFYTASDYARQLNSELADSDNRNVKLLRREIYCKILSMHDSSVDEVYWEIKKLFDYDKRATFRQDVRGYESNIEATEELLLSLEDWEKDLLLAQVQTQNISDYYDKLTYFKHYGIDYDEERITKEGIKLLIKCGAKLNHSLLGYTLYRYDYFSIIDRMTRLHAILDSKKLISKYNEAKHMPEFYWMENNTKNRLINLYYLMNCRFKNNEKISLDKLYRLFLDNDSIPENLLLDMVRENVKQNMSRKEQLLLAERLFIGEINEWNKCKKLERQLEENRRELHELEEQWNTGEEIEMVEFSEWVGEKDRELTENDILLRLSNMSYSQYVASRNIEATEELLANIDLLSLDEIRQKYFPVEERYEEL